MQNSIESPAQSRRRREAWQSAWLFSALMLVSGLGLLALRFLLPVEGLGGWILVLMALLDLGAIVPVWILLKNRLKEIEGGEEDAAAQY